MITTLVDVKPRLHVPFLEAFDIQHEPRAVLGRFFLQATEQFSRNGIKLSFAPFEEVVAVHAKNKDNWSFYNPMFDPSVADIAPSSFCIVGRDYAGRIVVTGSAKLFDASTRSFADIVNAGDYFALRPEHNVEGIGTRIISDVAERLYGQLGYCGGIWVHPDYRHLRYAAFVCRLVNATMLATWAPDVVLGTVYGAVAYTEYHRRYGFTHDAPNFAITRNGVTLYDTLLLWMSAQDAIEDTARFLDVIWPEINTQGLPSCAKKQA